eukprot:366366-Chlamydomonas_euryale.AAC.22
MAELLLGGGVLAMSVAGRAVACRGWSETAGVGWCCGRCQGGSAGVHSSPPVCHSLPRERWFICCSQMGCRVGSTLACAAYSPGDAELSSLLEDVRGMCAAAADSASTARNDSLRVAAVKLRETMVSLFSADASPPLPSGLAEGQPLPRLPSAVVLSVAADEQLKALQDMLRSLHAKQVRFSYSVSRCINTWPICLAVPWLTCWRHVMVEQRAG